MSTYLQDLKKANPAKYADRILAGCNHENGGSIYNLIEALSTCSWLNTPEDDKRLAAAKRLMRNRY